MLGLAACGSEPQPPPSPAPAPAAAHRALASADDSTVRAADYIGPDACGECHPTQYTQWRGSWHRVMNQRASDGTGPARAVLGDFSGVTLAYAGGTATFTRRGAEPMMTLARGGVTTRYRVTRTIGRRALQEYVGVADPGGAMEVRLPFGWWPRLGAWFAQPYFDPWVDESAFDAYAPQREPWSERCPWCHSTYPFERRVARSTAADYGNGFEQLVTTGAVAADPDAHAVTPASQITVGISCESCHLGGRAHAAGAPIHFVPLGIALSATAPAPTTFTQERADPAVLARVCGQCHTGSTPMWPSGAAMRNSAESTDLAGSACTTARCTDCHDPHTGGSDPARAIAACVRCHARYDDPAMAASHAGRGHGAVTCLDCHMPRLTMGVDRVVRSHAIAAPTNPRQLAAGAPTACSLCHLDRSMQWVLDGLREAYDVVPAIARAAGDDRDAPLGEQWLTSPEPAIRIVAADAYARSPLGPYVRHALVGLLDDELPHVRVFAQFAVERLLKRRLTLEQYDSRAQAPQRKAMVARLRTP